MLANGNDIQLQLRVTRVTHSTTTAIQKKSNAWTESQFSTAAPFLGD